MAPLDDRPPDTSLIPDPHVIRSRIIRLRTEARLLARLLKLAEDKLRVLPIAQRLSEAAGG